MKLLAWLPQMSLGIPVMDDAHKAFVETLAHLQTAPDHEFAVDLFAMIARLERDFREEETLMEQVDYSGLSSHREQHARVLGALHNVVPAVMRNEFDQARKVIDLLAQWFLFHLATMDSALAVALEIAGLNADPELLSNPQLPLGSRNTSRDLAAEY